MRRAFSCLVPPKKGKQPNIINDSVRDAEAEASVTAAKVATVSRAFGMLGFSPVRVGENAGIVQEYQKEYVESTGVRSLVSVVLDTGLAGSTPMSVRAFVVTRQSRIEPDVERLLSLPQSEPIHDMIALLNAINGPGEVVNAITVLCGICKTQTAEYRAQPDGSFACHWHPAGSNVDASVSANANSSIDANGIDEAGES